MVDHPLGKLLFIFIMQEVEEIIDLHKKVNSMQLELCHN